MNTTLLPRAIVKEAERLIRAGWTKGTFARDKAGQGVNPISPQATCFCVLGALTRAQHNLTGMSTGIDPRVIEAVQASVPYGSNIAVYNDADRREQWQVADLLYRASTLLP